MARIPVRPSAWVSRPLLPWSSLNRSGSDPGYSPATTSHLLIPSRGPAGPGAGACPRQPPRPVVLRPHAPGPGVVHLIPSRVPALLSASLHRFISRWTCSSRTCPGGLARVWASPILICRSQNRRFIRGCSNGCCSVSASVVGFPAFGLASFLAAGRLVCFLGGSYLGRIGSFSPPLQGPLHDSGQLA